MKICLLCDGITDSAQEMCSSCQVPLLDSHAVHFPLRRGESDAGHPLLGRLIDGKFRIQAVLGKGGMGTVFRATHEVSLVTVALKILNPKFSARREYREYFLAEAQKAGSVTHEHCSRVLDVGEAEDGTVYIAMEIVNGTTLFECIHAPVPLAPVLVVDILLQIAEALAAAHQVGLVHRDLSTRNVMVTVRKGDPFVKILDFGIAKGIPRAAADGNDNAVELSAPAGFANPPYSAPEHLRGKDVDARADLFSLGVIAYEALSQSLPVAGDTAEQMAQATLRGEFLPLAVPAGTPQALQHLISRLMAISPNDRPSSAEEVVEVLQRIRSSDPPFLRIAALFLLMFAVLGLVSSFLEVRQPELKKWDASFELSRSYGDKAVQELRSVDLQKEQKLEFDGFKPSPLRAELSVAGSTELETVLLHPDLDEPAKVLTLSTRQPSYRELLGRLKKLSANGHAVDLVFKTEQGKPLGVAFIRIDDEKPQINLRPSGDLKLGGMLCTDPSCELILQAQDQGVLQSLQLLLSDVQGKEQKHWPLDPAKFAQEQDLLQILPKMDMVKNAPLQGLGKVTLQVLASDKAGNVSKSEILAFERLDFRLPTVYPKNQAVLTCGSEGAWLALEMDEVERDLQVQVTGPAESNSEPWLAETRSPSNRVLELKFPIGAQGQLPSNGRYQLQILDRVGNRSSVWEMELNFEGRDLGLQFFPVASSNNGGQRHLVILDEDLVWDGSSRKLTLQCNERYQVVAANLQDARAVGASPIELQLLQTEPGKAALSLIPIADGLYDLNLTLLPQGGDTEDVQRSRSLRVMSNAMVLTLPALPQQGQEKDYLQGLVNLGLFTLDSSRPQAPLGQGIWTLTPADARLVHGKVWFGRNAGDWVSIPLLVAEAADGQLLPPLKPWVGSNLLGLELFDVLGRQVEIRFGSKGKAETLERLPLTETEDGSVVKLAQFYWHEDLARPMSNPAIDLEKGQDSPFSLQSPYAFNGEGIYLSLQRHQIEPLKVTANQAGGTRLDFLLKNLAMLAAMGMDPTDSRLEKVGELLTLKAELDTPAGKVNLDLSVRVIRSALSQLQVKELFPKAKAKGSLAEMSMVPVLRPVGTFVDRVAPTAWQRDRYRLHPATDVRNIPDFYLQQSELTRQQYLEILLAGLVEAKVPLPQTWPSGSNFVFPADPLGEDRLKLANMLPAWAKGDLGILRRRAQQAGNRPMTGVNFFQAYAISRLAGWIVDKDPDLFRLPLGVELELAALATKPRGQLNAQGGVTRRAHIHSAELMADPLRWPPTAGENRAFGDHIQTEKGELLALDFGVREWVLDLPYGVHQRDLLGTMFADHLIHLQQATQFFSNRSLDLARSDLAKKGVVRGLAMGEVDCLLMPISNSSPTNDQASNVGPLPLDVPGVVYTLYLFRNGLMQFNQSPDPNLAKIGFRLAGGERFVQKVRLK